MFLEAENQLVKLSDIVAARIGGVDDRTIVSVKKLHTRDGGLELIPVGAATSFSVWVARHVGRHRWRHHKIVFRTQDSSIISQWVDKINEIISRPGQCALIMFVLQLELVAQNADPILSNDDFITISYVNHCTQADQLNMDLSVDKIPDQSIIAKC